MILTRGFSFLMEHLTHLTPKTSFVVNKQKADNAEEILILDVTLDADQYILINLYNTETKQLKIFQEIQSLLKFFDINQKKWIMFAGDFNIFFNSKLGAKGGKPPSKRKSTSKLVDIEKSLDICDIWLIRNPKC